jgi:hypothetical protein
MPVDEHEEPDPLQFQISYHLPDDIDITGTIIASNIGAANAKWRRMYDGNDSITVRLPEAHGNGIWVFRAHDVLLVKITEIDT